MKNETGKHAVTGAFGFSGRYIAERLLADGRSVITLTNSPDRKNHFNGVIGAFPLSFDSPDRLAAALTNVEVLYNTYWVRFNHKTFNHSTAVQNTLQLFEAARRAGVGRIVHVSITNPSITSKLEYFHGKATLEAALAESGIPHTILRPAVLFGNEDILINNIAWVLRHLPFFPVFGYGSYRLQPISVKDFAELAIREGKESGNRTVNAIGPETYSFRGLIEKIGDIIGIAKPIIPVPPRLAHGISRLVSFFVGDVVVTREEIDGLMADLLCVDDKPTGKTRLSEWATVNREQLGVRYASELARRLDRSKPYLCTA